MIIIRRMLLSVLLLASRSITAEPARHIANSVKVYSYPCHEHQTRFEGTGSFLIHEGEVYVLTSEHVLLHSPTACHRIEHSSPANSVDALLHAVDWGVGLALLRLPNAVVPKQALRVEEFLNHATRVHDTVNLAGFAHGSPKLDVSPSGRILALDSPRHFLPTMGGITELVEAHAEFGWSGTTVYVGNNPVGVLSHQFLSGMGTSRRVFEFSTASARFQNHLLLIPSLRVAEWLKTILLKRHSVEQSINNVSASFIRDARAQLQGDRAVLTVGLKFSERRDNPYCDHIADLSADSLQNQESGGNDPSGAGGPPGERAGTSISVDISLQQADLPTHWFSADYGKWLLALKEDLLARKILNAPFLVYRNPDNGELKRVCSRSLAQFFRNLVTPNVRPVVLRLGVGDDREQKSWNSAFGKWIDSFSDVSASMYHGIDVRKYVQDFRSFHALLSSDEWMILRISDFQSLLNQEQQYKAFWEVLYQHDFDRAIELRRILVELQREHMRRVVDEF